MNTFTEWPLISIDLPMEMKELKQTQMTKFKCVACNRYLDYSFYVLGNPSNVSINLAMKTEEFETQTGKCETKN